MTIKRTDKAFEQWLSELPDAGARELAGLYPPESRWHLRGQDGKLDERTFYTPIGSTSDGRLIMLRCLPDGRPVQYHDGVSPDDLVPVPQGRA